MPPTVTLVMMRPLDRRELFAGQRFRVVVVDIDPHQSIRGSVPSRCVQLSGAMKNCPPCCGL